MIYTEPNFACSALGIIDVQNGFTLPGAEIPDKLSACLSNFQRI